MCIHMCVYIYIYIYTHTHTHTYAYAYTYTHTYTFTYTCTYTYTWMSPLGGRVSASKITKVNRCNNHDEVTIPQGCYTAL